MAITRAELPSLNDLRDRYLRDIRRLKMAAGVDRPNISPGSEAYIRGEAIASATLEILAKLAAVQDATMPDSAVEDDLDRLASVWRGITRSVGAGATGNVTVSCTGSVTYVEGQECTSPDGLRYAVVITTTTVNGGSVPIAGIDVGKETDKDPDTEMTWTSPPSGSADTALVATGGLSGGQDPDNDSRLRKRLETSLRHPLGSGSWGDYANWAEGASPAVQAAFVYPAVQGPCTVHVAIAVEATEDNNYSREASSALVQLVDRAIVAKSPEHADVTVQSVDNESLNLVMQLSLPAHRTDGGPGGGWLNKSSERWPAIGASPYITYVTTAPSVSNVLRMFTFSEPTNGAYIVVWNSVKKKWLHARIASHSLVSGTTYDVTLYSAVDINDLSGNEPVCPDAENMDNYAKTIAESCGKLGPGEKTADTDYLPRSYRHPLSYESWPNSYTARDVSALTNNYPEISHVTVNSPTLPDAASTASSAGAAPYIQVLGTLAFYPS